MSAHQPLDGIRVVELGTSVAGPYGTWILGTLGAEVVKVERPEVGDDCRQWGPPSVKEGIRSFFLALNANKKSVVVDFTDKKQLDRLRRYIVEKADVVLQNLRPGLVEKLGLDAGTLMAKNKRLIYCHSGAFGVTGPYKDRPGYDPLMQACGGIMSVNGEEGRPPARVGTSIVDMGTGMWCAMGILAALNDRHVTGKGCRIDTSLYETALGWMNYHAAGYYGTGKPPKRRRLAGAGHRALPGLRMRRRLSRHRRRQRPAVPQDERGARPPRMGRRSALPVEPEPLGAPRRAQPDDGGGAEDQAPHPLGGQARRRRRAERADPDHGRGRRASADRWRSASCRRPTTRRSS